MKGEAMTRFEGGVSPMDGTDVIELLSAIVGQTKEDYCEAYKVLSKWVGKPKFDREAIKKKILLDTAKLDPRLNALDDAINEIQIDINTDGKTEEQVIAKKVLRTKRDKLNARRKEMDAPWDAIMMMESCEKYLGTWEVQMYTDLEPQEITQIWDKEMAQVMKSYKPRKASPKLTEEQITQILELYASGMSGAKIAQKLGCSRDPVYRYIRERSNQ